MGIESDKPHKDEFASIITSNFPGVETRPGEETYFDHLVSVILDNRFNGDEATLNNSRQEAAWYLFDAGAVTSLEAGVEAVDQECHRIIRENTRIKRENGEA